MLHSLVFAARSLRQRPGFSTAAILTLALGIGLNTTIFGIVNTMLFRPLPVDQPERLAWILSASTDPNGPRGHLTYPDVREFAASPALDGATAYADTAMSVSTGQQALRVKGQLVVANYFAVVGVRVSDGRPLSDDRDGAPGAPPAAVVSDSLARRLFVEAPAAVGRDLIVNGRPFTIVGVAPPGFVGAEPFSAADVWVSVARHEDIFSSRSDRLGRGDYWLRGIGRLAPGVSWTQAEAALRVTAAAIGQAHPDSHPGFLATLSPVRGVLPSQRSEVASLSGLILAASLMVLLVACANVANLQLVRSAARAREIGIRLAMGATRGDLVRLLLVESLLLALAGGAAAVLLAMWTTEPLLALLDIPLVDGVAFDLRVIGVTIVLALGTTLAFGVVPARRASRASVLPALRGEAADGRRRAASRPQRLLVVAQVALSLVLVTAAGLFVRSLQQVPHVDVGFEWRDRVALEFNLRLQGYSAERAKAFQRTLLERVRATPGVAGASLAQSVPLGDRLFVYQVTRPDAVEPVGRAFGNLVDGAFFDTLGIPILHGRALTADDQAGPPRVAVVNEAMVRRYWPDRDPIGERFSLEGPRGPFVEVVGVARDIKQDELAARPEPFAYLPYTSGAEDAALIVRTSTDEAAMLRALEAQVHALDPNVPVVEAMTLAQHIAGRVDTERGLSRLIGAFGALAVALALVGLYGVMAFIVRGRTREIGIRLAIGARREEVAREFLVEGLRLAIWGLAAGLPIALALSAVLSSSLVGVRTADPVTFSIVLAALVAVAAAAAAIPAARAARVDPLTALRVE